MVGMDAIDQLEQALVSAVREEQARPKIVRAGATRRGLPGGTVAVLAMSVVISAGFALTGSSEGGPGGLPPILAVDSAEAQVVVEPIANGYRIEFGNLQADQEAVRAALQERGLPVEVTFVPSSPTLVGQLVVLGGTVDRSSLQYEYRQGEMPSADAVAVTVSDSFDGQLELSVGRRAQPGEMFTSSAQSALQPGEALHCLVVEGKTIGEIAPAIAARGVELEVRDPKNRSVDVEDVRDLYVDALTPWAPGEVFLSARQDPPPNSYSAEYRALLSRGC